MSKILNISRCLPNYFEVHIDVFSKFHLLIIFSGKNVLKKETNAIADVQAVVLHGQQKEATLSTHQQQQQQHHHKLHLKIFSV